MVKSKSNEVGLKFIDTNSWRPPNSHATFLETIINADFADILRLRDNDQGHVKVGLASALDPLAARGSHGPAQTPRR